LIRIPAYTNSCECLPINALTAKIKQLAKTPSTEQELRDEIEALRAQLRMR